MGVEPDVELGVEPVVHARRLGSGRAALMYPCSIASENVAACSTKRIRNGTVATDRVIGHCKASILA